MRKPISRTPAYILMLALAIITAIALLVYNQSNI